MATALWQDFLTCSFHFFPQTPSEGFLRAVAHTRAAGLLLPAGAPSHIGDHEAAGTTISMLTTSTNPARGCLWPQPATFCASPAAVRLPLRPQNLSLQRVSPACSSTKPSPSLQPRAGVRCPAADPTARPKGTSSPSAEPKSSSLLKIHS